MKTLLANGCSWTYGGGLDTIYSLDELARITWPNKLRELLNFDQTINLSMGCGSNQRIFRTTFDWVTSQPLEVLKNTVAVIQWTEPSRYEYYVPDKDFTFNYTTGRYNWENIEDNWALVKSEVVISEAEQTLPRAFLLEKANARLVDYTILEGMYRNLSHYESLSSLFRRYNIPYYYWDVNTAYSYLPQEIELYISNNYTWLEQNGRHTWRYERISKEDSHPSIIGHAQIAEYIKMAIDRINVTGQ